VAVPKAVVVGLVLNLVAPLWSWEPDRDGVVQNAARSRINQFSEDGFARLRQLRTPTKEQFSAIFQLFSVKKLAFFSKTNVMIIFS
jgi:hypothetical protein